MHEVISAQAGKWIIMDRVLPGGHLPKGCTSPDIVAALAAMLGLMVGQPSPCPGMLSIADWLQQRLEDDELAGLAPGTGVAPPDRR